MIITPSDSPPATSELSTPVVKAKVPPISKLYQDILLHIFHLNTFVPESEHPIHNPEPSPSSALNVARYSSQTCRMWRHTILASPALWGNIIDTTAITFASTDWAQEVMQRTGDCPLSVYGRVGLSGQLDRFLEIALVRNWHRVRRLDVTLEKPMLLTLEPWRTVLQQKSGPLLETFIIEGVGHMSAIGMTGFGPVFGGALLPSLQRFHCRFCKIGPGALWIAQLSSVTLSYPFTLADIFTILLTTVRLESLFIKHLPPDNVEAELREAGTTVHLPHLRLLHISCRPTQALAILRKICGHPDCALSVKIRDYVGNIITPEKMEELTRLIAPYARRFFDLHSPPKMPMILGTYPFSVASEAPTDMKSFAHPVFMSSFDITPYSAINGLTATTRSPSLTRIFLPVLASLPLGSVTALEFSKEHDSQNTPLTPDSSWLEFLKALPSVHELTITQDTLDILTDNCFATASQVVFPLLDTVRLRHVSPSTASSGRFAKNLVHFLSRRASMSRSVLTLDLSLIRHTLEYFDWGFLDVVEGLNVVWTDLDSDSDSKEVRYVCGSGEKARLEWGNHLNESMNQSVNAPTCSLGY